jgi:hypothetical protein
VYLFFVETSACSVEAGEKAWKSSTETRSTRDLPYRQMTVDHQQVHVREALEEAPKAE